MSKGRLEAFSDGVIAILITIMILEFKTPEGTDWASLRPLLPVFVTYVVSFTFLGIYWNNHHHMFHVVKHVNGKILWANLHLLFWLSMVPITTAWIGQNPSASLPTAAYGTVFLLSAIAYTILARLLVQSEGPQSKLAAALGRDRKGKISLACYLTAVPVAFYYPWAADALYVVVALIWFVPDKRIESVLKD